MVVYISYASLNSCWKYHPKYFVESILCKCVNFHREVVSHSQNVKKNVEIRFSQTKTNKRGDIIMTQGVLSFKYEEEKKDFGSTSTAGLLLF